MIRRPWITLALLPPLLGGSPGGSPPAGTPAPSSSPPSGVSKPFTKVVWQADFDRSRNPCDVRGAGWGSYGGPGYPPCPAAVRILGVKRGGVPAGKDFRRVVRMRTRPVDARRGAIMGKLNKPFFAPGYADGQRPVHETRPPADISGSYRAWFYLPKRFRIRGSGWRNIFQFKERFWNGQESGYQSEPTWYVVLYNRRGRGSRPPVVGIRYWNNGSVRGVGRARAFPLGRWVQLRAEVHQYSSITWRLGGRIIARSSGRSYPIGPRHGSRSLAWDFGVGNYAGAGSGSWRNRLSAPLFVGRAELLR